MKTKRRTLCLLLVLAVLAAAALYALTVHNTEAEQAASAAEEGSIPLSSFTAEELEQIAVTYGGETLTLDYDGGLWTLEEDPAYHLDTSACNTMLTNLSALNAKRALTAQSGEDYGFDAPQAVVTVTAAGQTNTFTFGAENSVTGDLYLQKSGDDAVYTVASTKLGCFEVDKASLFGAFNPAGLTSSDIEAVSYTLASGETVALKAVSEPAADSTAESAADATAASSSEAEADSTTYQTVWRLEDEPDAALDETNVNDLLSALCAYVSGQITDGTPADYGFDAPLVTAHVTTADGTVTVRYAAGTDGYYLMVEGDTSVYTVDGTSIAALTHTAEQLKADSAQAE